MRLLRAEESRLREVLDASRDDRGDGGQADRSGELADYDQHPAEAGTETFNRERDASVAAQAHAQLAALAAARQRVRDGTFGRCEVCGRPIGDERLEAVPTARYCIEHQAAASAPPRLEQQPRG